MSAIRVTQGVMVQQVLNNLHGQNRRILQLQDQLATGLRVTSPTDDPIAARRAINTRGLIAENEIPNDVAGLGVEPELLAPERLR